MSESRPLLLFGGSFDPVHGGHLRMASYFARRGYDVLLLPAGSPRWKKTESSGEMRLLLLRLALASLGEEGIEIDPRELHREGESRTIDTVLEIREENPGRELALLLGADQAIRFPEWREAERLSRLAKVLYIPRDGIEVPGDIKERFHMEEVPYKGAGLVSSTSIREIHSLDLPGQELLAIEGHRLYLWGKIAERMGEGRYEHSLSVAHLCREIASYNRLGERMELLAYRAGLLHDLGKCIELSGPVATEYTLEGKLLGHINIMAGIVREEADRLKIGGETPDLLAHMILSHHGKPEFGSPVLPLTREAMALSMIDDFDAKMNMLDKALEGTKPGNWTERIFAFDNRSFYKPKRG